MRGLKLSREAQLFVGWVSGSVTHAGVGFHASTQPTFILYLIPPTHLRMGSLKFPLTERLKDKHIKEVQIHPKYSARWFEIEYIYEDEKIETSLDSEKAIAMLLRKAVVRRLFYLFPPLPNS